MSMNLKQLVELNNVLNTKMSGKNGSCTLADFLGNISGKVWVLHECNIEQLNIIKPFLERVKHFGVHDVEDLLCAVKDIINGE